MKNLKKKLFQIHQLKLKLLKAFIYINILEKRFLKEEINKIN